MSEEFDELFAGTQAAFSQDRVFLQARTLAISSLAGLGRRIISGMLCTSAQQFSDWSAVYRPRKGSPLLYRQPAYLICTDPALPLSQLLRAYLWRWEIELNFRDEKTLLGVGQAQVRTPASVETVPALIVAAYAMLLLAGASICNSEMMLRVALPLVTQQRTDKS